MALEILKIFLTVIALVFTAIQILFLTRQIKINKKWNAQDASFKYCMSYGELLNGLSSDIKNCLNLIVIDELNESSEFYVNLFNIKTPEGIKNREEVNKILQYYERLSVGILNDYFDEEIVRRIMNRTVVTTYNNLRPYIMLRRGETKSNLNTHFERVAESWAKTPLNYPFRSTPSNRTKK